MAFLLVSGIPVQLDAGSPFQYRQELVGATSRSYSGRLTSSVRGRKWAYSGTTGPMLLAEALALRNLINGLGHSWSFDSGSISSTGIAPSLVTGGAGAVLGLSKYGTGRLYCPPGSSIRWPLLQFDSTVYASTVAAWVRVPVIPGGAWAHVVFNKETEDTYLNGAPWYTWPDVEDDTGMRLTLTSDYLEVSYVAGRPGVLEVDDLVLLPYPVPTSWLLPWRSAGVPFGPLPFHSLAGTGIHAPLVRASGEAGDGTVIELWTPGGQRLPHESFDIEFKEI